MLPPSWAGTDCLDGRNVTVARTFIPRQDGGGGDNWDAWNADFTMVAPDPLWGAEPRARQFGQCGAAGRGVALPYPLVTTTGRRPDGKTGERICSLASILC